MAHKTLSLFGGLALSFCLASPTFAAKVALSDNQMDAITAGQETPMAMASLAFNISAAGATTASVTASDINVITSAPTMDNPLWSAIISGTLTSTSN